YADLTRLDKPGLEAAAARLAAARGLVFDLRGDAVVGTEVLSHLLDKEAPSGIWEVPVTWLPDQQEVHRLRTVWTIGPRAPRFRARVAFLVDERAVGYTETLVTIAEHQRLGRLVGSPSAGGNGTINRTDLPGGFRLTFTGQSVLKPDGTPLQGNGVQPEEAIRPTREGVAAGRDEVLEAAVRFVRGADGS
ncbi:MAG: S41 family peptidase, partial [Thermoanaerobaculia bacterium]|nr:S41 family peptidase [Thermoanaerobaculia bacterium]